MLAAWLMVALGAALLVVFLVCAYAGRLERALAEHRVASDLGTRIGRHGIWVGAWLVAIPAKQAQRVRDEARSEAARGAPPERILSLWESAGGRLLSHLPGPEVTTEAEACGWLEHTADELTEAPVSPLAASDGRSLLALVYASTEPPPTHPAAWSELRRRLLGPACLGAAFVSCRGGAANGADHRVPLRALGVAKWAFLVAGIAGLACGGVTMALSEGAPVVTTSIDAGVPESGPATAVPPTPMAAVAITPPAVSIGSAAASATASVSAAVASPADAGTEAIDAGTAAPTPPPANPTANPTPGSVQTDGGTPAIGSARTPKVPPTPPHH